MMEDAELVRLFVSIGAGLGMTFVMTIVAFVLGALLAVPIAVMRTSKYRFLVVLATVYIEVLRGIPTLMWLLLIYFGLSPLIAFEPLTAALIGLTLISAAYLAENLRAGLENVHPTQREAAAALGLTDNARFWRVIAPQAVNIALPSSASWGVALLKDSAMASIIGVSDVIFYAEIEVSRGTSAVTAFTVAGICYLVISIPLSYFSRYVDHQVRKRVVSA